MVHIGQNIAKIRGLKLMTQKEIAASVNLSQPEYSRIEQKAEVDDDILDLIATALGVSKEAILSFRDDSVFTNNIYEQNNSISQVYFQSNPIETIVALYERLLKEKDELIKLKDEELKNHKK